MNKRYKMVIVKCEYCDKEFYRIDKEVKRSIKLGRRQFCSRKCCGLGTNDSKSMKKRIPEAKRQIAWKTIRNYSDNRRDSLSPYRYFIHCIKNRSKEKEIVTVYDIKKQWEKQNGVCPYTGLKLELPQSTAGFKEKIGKMDNASIDRIDSSKGYTKDNIQFVSCMANYAKNEFSHKDMIRFCKIIANKWK